MGAKGDAAIAAKFEAQEPLGAAVEVKLDDRGALIIADLLA